MSGVVVTGHGEWFKGKERVAYPAVGIEGRRPRLDALERDQFGPRERRGARHAGQCEPRSSRLRGALESQRLEEARHGTRGGDGQRQISLGHEKRAWVRVRLQIVAPGWQPVDAHRQRRGQVVKGRRQHGSQPLHERACGYEAVAARTAWATELYRTLQRELACHICGVEASRSHCCRKCS